VTYVCEPEVGDIAAAEEVRDEAFYVYERVVEEIQALFRCILLVKVFPENVYFASREVFCLGVFLEPVRVFLAFGYDDFQYPSTRMILSLTVTISS